MTGRSLPELTFAKNTERNALEVPPALKAAWQKCASLRMESTDRTVSILDVIGADFFGEGVTTRRIAGALRALGDGPVTVQINSPGGDIFEAVAIYNLLRMHQGEVTVQVLGMAASSASIIAMAGDRIEMGAGAQMFLHNAWSFVAGNAGELRALADDLDKADGEMAALYAARAGVEPSEAMAWMAADTWFTGAEAVEAGLADAIVDMAPTATPDDQIEARASGPNASACARPTSVEHEDTMTDEELETVRAEARAEGARAEAERLANILGAEGVTGDATRIAAAMDLAASAPDMAADKVVEFVAKHGAKDTPAQAPKSEKGLNARAGVPDSLAGAGVGSGIQGNAATENWKKIAAKRNSKLERTH